MAVDTDETAKNTAANASSSAVDAVAASKPASVSLSSSLTISHTVKQKIHVCASHKKPRLLLKYVTMMREAEKAAKVRQAGPMIIFCNKIKTLKFVQDFLKRQSVRSDALHGQLAQHVREAILANFKSVRIKNILTTVGSTTKYTFTTNIPCCFLKSIQGKTNILVSTDVAARGIHISRLQYVVNYDFPLNLEQYCHRVGRTGRQDREGFAYSLLTRNLGMLAQDLIKLLEVCQQQPEPNLLKLAEDYALGKILGDTEEGDDEEEENEGAEGANSDPDDE